MENQQLMELQQLQQLQQLQMLQQQQQNYQPVVTMPPHQQQQNFQPNVAMQPLQQQQQQQQPQQQQHFQPGPPMQQHQAAPQFATNPSPYLSPPVSSSLVYAPQLPPPNSATPQAAAQPVPPMVRPVSPSSSATAQPAKSTGCCSVPQELLTDDQKFQKNCRDVKPAPKDMAASLKYTLDGSRLAPPSANATAPQPISTMGQPNIDAVVKAGAKDFYKKTGGWYKDKSNPDSDEAREVRLRKVFDAAYSSSDGGDRAGIAPELQDICLPSDKIIASLNCVEVIGMPDSSVSKSEGFIQAAIIERGGNPKTRRLAIIASNGNANIKATESVFQKFSKNCFGLCKSDEIGAKYFEYGVQVQESHELSVINVDSAVVHVSVTKKKSKDYKAWSGGGASQSCMECCTNCCSCFCKCCLWCYRCQCCECNCFDTCCGERFISFNLSLSRQFGFTSAVKDESVKTSTGSSIASGDGPLAKERWITSSEKAGIKKTGRTVDEQGQFVWNVEELVDDRLIITITYRSMVSKSLKQCQLITKNCLDLSGSDKAPSNTWAAVSRFVAELLPTEIDDRAGKEAPFSSGIASLGLGSFFGRK